VNIKLIVFALFAAACAKESTLVEKTPEQLLTQKQWKLVSHGFDSNNNQKIDLSEEMAEDCEKDNNYVFYANGTGIVEDNVLKCTNGVSDFSFNWKFIYGQKTLDLFYGILHIQKMNEDELILISDDAMNGQAVRHISIYGH